MQQSKDNIHININNNSDSFCNNKSGTVSASGGGGTPSISHNGSGLHLNNSATLSSSFGNSNTHHKLLPGLHHKGQSTEQQSASQSFCLKQSSSYHEIFQIQKIHKRMLGGKRHH